MLTMTLIGARDNQPCGQQLVVAHARVERQNVDESLTEALNRQSAEEKGEIEMRINLAQSPKIQKPQIRLLLDEAAKLSTRCE